MIYCNECKYEFEPKIRTKYIEDDVEEVFFNCPNCNERYISYYTNNKIKSLQHEMRKNALNKYKQGNIKKQIADEMDRLEKLVDTQ